MNAFEIAVERFSAPNSGQVAPMLVEDIAPDMEGPPMSDPVKPLTDEERSRLSAQWAATPVILMLPEGRRAEAEAILAERPGLRAVLESCKRGLLNCWDAMEALGMDPYDLGEVPQ